MSAAALALQARAELAALSYPTKSWVIGRHDPAGSPIHAAVIVGAGQSGLAIAAGLHRRGVDDVVLLDRAPPGGAGVWRDFARMAELRTPKGLNGMEFGCPSLSVASWYAATHGHDAWAALDRIPREAWADYLHWYQATLGLSVVHGTAVEDIRPDGVHGGALTVVTRGPDGPGTILARTVVIATGFDGAGSWRVPAFIGDALPPDRYDHTNGPVDFGRLRGARVAVLGHGASAFDNANAALVAGAARVDLCFRRDRLPRVNPHRHLEDAGTMAHFPLLDDVTRWRVARHVRRIDQPPPRRALETALAHPAFHLHPGRPWLGVGLDQGAIRVETSRGPILCDHLLCATGVAVNPAARPELTSLAPVMARWADCYEPSPEDADDRLAAYPYLAEDFGFTPRHARDCWVKRVFCFNGASAVSHGPHAASISGHRYALPRVVEGLARLLFVDQAGSFLDSLVNYADLDLDLPEGFEARHLAPDLPDVGAAPHRTASPPRFRR